MNSKSELISAYFDYYRTKDDSLYWAWEAVDDAMHELEPGLQICLELIETAKNDIELAYVAAGPLEDLLTRAGLSAAEALEAPANRSRKVWLTLSLVWLDPKAAAYKKWCSLVQEHSDLGSGTTS